MNIQEFLRRPVAASSWSGEWVRIWMRPDVFSAQDYLVGVAAVDERGVVDFRVITGAAKFECIYGRGNGQAFERMLADLRSCLHGLRANRLPVSAESLPPSFRLEPVGLLREQLPSEALERMLADGSMPMQEDAPKGKKTRFASKAASDVVDDVLNQLRLRRAGLADKIICEDYYGDKQHQVGVNLVTPVAAGVVASGWYASADRIQLEFLLGVNKLETYVAATGRARHRSGFFFMRPTIDDGLPSAVATDVENRLDQLDWRLKQMQIRSVVLSSASAIAEEVCDWAEQAG